MSANSWTSLFKRWSLEAAYKGEVLCSRLQGIAGNDPRFNGEYALLRKLAPRIKLAVDAGSNVGDWTAEVLRRAGPAVRVACLEADPRNAERIAQRFLGNESVRVWNAAVADAIGKARFLIGKGSNSGAGHLVPKLEANTETIEVDTVTLDYIAQQYTGQDIDFVKVDIEGAEMALLRGARGLFAKQRIGVMQLEYNTTWLAFGTRFGDLFGFAAGYGYQVMVATPFGAVRIPVYAVGLEDYRLRNVILARPDLVEPIEPFGPAGRARVEADANVCNEAECKAR